MSQAHEKTPRVATPGDAPSAAATSVLACACACQCVCVLVPSAPTHAIEREGGKVLPTTISRSSSRPPLGWRGLCVRVSVRHVHAEGGTSHLLRINKSFPNRGLSGASVVSPCPWVWGVQFVSGRGGMAGRAQDLP